MAEVENENEKNSELSSPKEETPIRAVVCLKRKEDMKRFEETEDCFILEFDPSESLDLRKLSLDNKNHDEADLSIVAEKAAPCKYWTRPIVPHCDADSPDYWKEKRNVKKKKKSLTNFT